MSALPPWYYSNPTHWLTPKQVAERMDKSLTTIRRWCRDGTLIEAGFQLYRGASGQYRIKTPPERHLTK